MCPFINEVDNILLQTAKRGNMPLSSAEKRDFYTITLRVLFFL
jgi:hypothetical protein